MSPTTPRKTAAKQAAAPREKAAPKKTAAKRPATDKPVAEAQADAPRRIDARIAELGDWRGQALARVRALIHAADPQVVEEIKWRGTPVWSHDGILCTGESYKDKIKLTFAKGAKLADPKRLFNSSLDGNARRALDIFEGDPLDEAAFKALIKAAVAANRK